jgi:electron transfer flavoprotein-quinone oxidoreductase
VEQVFDAIVVGAGPAGSACAYRLAKEGLQVLVAERGKFPGAKNTWGGAFYGPALNDLLPAFGTEKPWERYVRSHRISVLNEHDCLSVEFAGASHQKAPYNGVILLRSRFDRWLADKAQEAGAVMAAGMAADDLVKEGDRIIGIKAGEDTLRARVVVACDGVNSQLAQKAGLRGELKPSQLKQGVKEVLSFPRATLEQRFGLKGDEGIAWEFFGTFTHGIPGGAFIYTNRETLSIGVVVQLSALADKQLKAVDILEDFKRHPEIARLVEGGKLEEYAGHLIPVAGVGMMPRLYAPGMLVAGDAAALVLATGLTLEGANFAVASGVAAAETVIEAKGKDDFSALMLSSYVERLRRSFVLKDMQSFRNAPHFLENQRIYTAYPELVCGLAEKIFTSNGQPRERLLDIARGEMKGRVTLMQMAQDLWQAKGAL